MLVVHEKKRPLFIAVTVKVLYDLTYKKHAISQKKTKKHWEVLRQMQMTTPRRNHSPKPTLSKASLGGLLRQHSIDLSSLSICACWDVQATRVMLVGT